MIRILHILITYSAAGLFMAAPVHAAFVDNGDGTVSDNDTGLMWDRCTWGQTVNDCSGGTASTHIWSHALGVAVTANAANYKGHNDWRLPNIKELESLVKTDAINPSIETGYFPGTVFDYYWSSTINVQDPGRVWRVSFAAGWVLSNGQHGDLSYVRLVRSGQSFALFDAQSTDDDGDGVADATEDAGPNGGDGNDDGIPDSVQPGVASLPKASGGGYLTVQTSCPDGLTGVQAHTEASQGGGDASFNMPYGLIDFSAPCDIATFTVFYHGVTSVAGMTYRKYGPTTPGDVGTAAWYTLPGVTFATADVNGETVATAQFILTDGDLGDDTSADGVIVDQGGVGNVNANGAGGAQSIPALGPLGLVLLSGMLGLAGWLGARRHRGA